MGLRDADLLSVQEARTLAARAKAAQQVLAGFSQEQVDRIVDAAAQAARGAAERLARLAHEETGFGNVPDKTKKNLVAAQADASSQSSSAHAAASSASSSASGAVQQASSSLAASQSAGIWRAISSI